MDFLFGRQHHVHRRPFNENYKCFPASFFGKEEVEKGNLSNL